VNPGSKKAADASMKSPMIKRSIVIAGHKTSVSIEDPFWTALKDIAQSRRQSLAELIGAIDGARQIGNDTGNLSSAIRVFVLDHYRGRDPPS
jgi:predicted DNA-binding ribbon-helix-helix protein